jgi:hypothetical protein
MGLVVMSVFDNSRAGQQIVAAALMYRVARSGRARKRSVVTRTV